MLMVGSKSVAEIAHELNRLYCEAIGDLSQPAWADAPDWQRASAYAGVEAIADGRVTRPEESHEGWLKQKRADGWAYGPEKIPELKLHPCMLPFDELPAEQQTKDRLFFGVVSALIGKETR